MNSFLKFLIILTAVVVAAAIIIWFFVPGQSRPENNIPAGSTSSSQENYQVIAPKDWQKTATDTGKTEIQPPKGVIIPEEAVRLVRQIPGYENVEILEAQAIYNSEGQIWQWEVKTSHGIVTVNAENK